MEGLLHTFHPRLLAHEPTDGERGEEAETLALGEVLRAVVAEVELCHVAVVVGQREAAGDALLAVVLNATVVVGLLVVEQQGVDVGLAEAAVVHQVGLEIDACVTIFGALLRAHRLVAGLKLRVDEVALLVAPCSREHGAGIGGARAA